jgi:hypothetical protein
MINLYTTYLDGEVSREELAAAHEKLRNWISANFDANLDTRPGSVFGDLNLNPEAFIQATSEKALTNFCSDLDLANAASGKIYNCDFVSAYVQNFSSRTYTEITSSGTIRLVFTDSNYREIDKGLQFRSGEQIFLPRVYSDGPIKILPPGQTPEAGSNDFVLYGLGDRFFTEISVYSMDAAEIANLEEFEVSENITGLVSVYAVGDFWSASTSNSLPDVANKTRITAISANATSRSGLVRLIQQEFPDTLSISPVLSGDYEMAQQVINPLGLTIPKIDLYVRTPLYGTTFKQPFKLYLDETDNSYFGEVNFIDPPLKIDSVNFADLTGGNLTFEDYIVSSNVNLPALSCVGSKYSRIFIRIPVPKDSTGAPLLPSLPDDVNGGFYQNFEVTYRTDPGMKVIDNFLSSPDTKPVGVDIVVKMFHPIDFSALYVNYARRRGVKLNQAKASTEINQYLSAIAWPDTYSDAQIIDSMFYAGASNVYKIESDAKLLVAPTQYLLREIPEDANDAKTNKELIPVAQIQSSYNFGSKSRDENPDFETNMHYATGPKNISFLIDSTKILFRENGTNVL